MERMAMKKMCIQTDQELKRRFIVFIKTAYIGTNQQRKHTDKTLQPNM